MAPVFSPGATVSGLTCQQWNRNLDRWDNS